MGDGGPDLFLPDRMIHREIVKGRGGVFERGAAGHVIAPVGAHVHARGVDGQRQILRQRFLGGKDKGETLARLNRIKRRESFRPIAPLCIEEDMERYFQPADKTPYMLEFCRVISDKIPAVTHVDQSARPQSVSKDNLPELYELLISFRHLTGTSVLCNTSLNFNGFGFINRLSDLEKFSLAHGLDGFVFEDRLFLKKP